MLRRRGTVEQGNRSSTGFGQAVHIRERQAREVVRLSPNVMERGVVNAESARPPTEINLAGARRRIGVDNREAWVAKATGITKWFLPLIQLRYDKH